MAGLGKLLLAIGGIVIVIGLVLIGAERFHLPLGRLPGDITYRSRNVTVFFPLATCLLLSLLISLVMWFLNRK